MGILIMVDFCPQGFVYRHIFLIYFSRITWEVGSQINNRQPLKHPGRGGVEKREAGKKKKLVKGRMYHGGRMANMTFLPLY